MKRTSSARRVYSFLQKALDTPVPSERPAFMIWAKVFDIVQDDHAQLPGDAENQLFERLRDLRDEVSAVEASVSGEPAQIVAPLAETVRTMTSAPQLIQGWSHIRANFLRPDFIAGWRSVAVFLPSEEVVADQAAIEGLEHELGELIEEAQREGVPAELRRYVLAQAASIRQALEQYSLRGAEPLRGALASATGNLVLEQEALRSAAEAAPQVSSGILSKVRGVLGTAAGIAGDADKVAKGMKLIGQIYEKAKPMITHAGPAIEQAVKSVVQ